MTAGGLRMRRQPAPTNLPEPTLAGVAGLGCLGYNAMDGDWRVRPLNQSREAGKA